jgi:hypothetical protein
MNKRRKLDSRRDHESVSPIPEARTTYHIPQHAAALGALFRHSTSDGLNSSLKLSWALAQTSSLTQPKPCAADRGLPDTRMTVTLTAKGSGGLLAVKAGTTVADK